MPTPSTTSEPVCLTMSTSEKFEFVKALYDERMIALNTVMSIKVVYELTKAFDLPMTEFCQYLSQYNS